MKTMLNDGTEKVYLPSAPRHNATPSKLEALIKGVVLDPSIRQLLINGLSESGPGRTD